MRIYLSIKIIRNGNEIRSSVSEQRKFEQGTFLRVIVYTLKYFTLTSCVCFNFNLRCTSLSDNLSVRTWPRSNCNAVTHSFEQHPLTMKPTRQLYMLFRRRLGGRHWVALIELRSGSDQHHVTVRQDGASRVWTVGPATHTHTYSNKTNDNGPPTTTTYWFPCACHRRLNRARVVDSTPLKHLCTTVDHRPSPSLCCWWRFLSSSSIVDEFLPRVLFLLRCLRQPTCPVNGSSAATK